MKDLSAEERLTIYNEVDLQFNMQDARNHAKDIMEQYNWSDDWCDYDNESLMVIFCLNCLTDDDFKYLADEFRINHDCNVADNEQWEDLVRDYISRDIMEEPRCKISGLYAKYKAEHPDDAECSNIEAFCDTKLLETFRNAEPDATVPFAVNY